MSQFPSLISMVRFLSDACISCHTVPLQPPLVFGAGFVLLRLYLLICPPPSLLAVLGHIVSYAPTFMLRILRPFPLVWSASKFLVLITEKLPHLNLSTLILAYLKLNTRPPIKTGSSTVLLLLVNMVFAQVLNLNPDQQPGVIIGLPHALGTCG